MCIHIHKDNHNESDHLTGISPNPGNQYNILQLSERHRESPPHISGLVVEVTVIEHLPIVLHTLLGTAVDTVLQFLLDGAHVHGPLHNLEIVLQYKELCHHDIINTPYIYIDILITDARNNSQVG